MQQRTVWFSGHVQGVGFRQATERIARGFAVTGTVRNLEDGRVELVAEGDPDEVARFVREVESVLGQFIRSTTTDHRPATGRHAGFRVVR